MDHRQMLSVLEEIQGLHDRLCRLEVSAAGEDTARMDGLIGRVVKGVTNGVKKLEHAAVRAEHTVAGKVRRAKSAASRKMKRAEHVVLKKVHQMEGSSGRDASSSPQRATGHSSD